MGNIRILNTLNKPEMLVALSGTFVLMSGFSTPLTISNYDSSTQYAVQVNKGSATIDGNVITYTAGTELGTAFMDVAAGAESRRFILTVIEATTYIATPTATPAAFGDALEGGFYAGMIWNEVIQSSTSAAIGTGTKVFTVADMTAVPLFYGGQTLEIRSRANPANKMVGTVTGALTTNLTLSVTSVEGSGTFTDWSVMSRYRVIVAPKATGELLSTKVKSTADALPAGCQTASEGYKATLAMLAAGSSAVYPAAWACDSLSINGHSDWYLPARDEVELCYRNLKPYTTNNSVAARVNSAISYKTSGAYADATTGNGANLNSYPTGAAYSTTIPGQVAAGKNFRTGESEALSAVSQLLTSSDYSTSSVWSSYMVSGSISGFQTEANKTNTTFVVRAVRRSII